MPVGPSHSSHGGGSHSGGGSHHGGGSYHGSGYSSGGSFIGGLIGGAIVSAISEKRRQRFYDRYGYYPDKNDYDGMPRRTAPTVFLFIAIIFGFFLFVTATLMISTKKDIKTAQNNIEIMEKDWIEYKDLINNAETKANYYSAQANFGIFKYTYYDDNPTDVGAYLDFERNGISYYFIVYEYTDAVDSQIYTGTTYTQFSANQIQQLGGKIDIVYYHNGSETYSINKNYNLDTCEEYLYRKDIIEENKSSVPILTTFIIIEVLICALFVAIFIVKMKNYNKLIKQDDELIFQKRQAETQKAQAEASQAAEEVAKKNRFCKYCGCKINPDTNSCPSCGARLSK